MPDSGLTAIRPKWNDSCMELICGIANAGGGSLIIPSRTKDRALAMRKMNRVLERIPTQTMRMLGVSYFAEPVMDGDRLSLEIDIPAAVEPMSYEGKHYYFVDDELTVMSESEIMDISPSSEQRTWEARMVPLMDDSTLDYDAMLLFESAYEQEEGSRSFHDDLEYLRLKDDRLRGYTNAGALLLGSNPERFIPGASIRVGLFGAGSHDLRFQEEAVGALTTQLAQTLEVLYDRCFDAVRETNGESTIFPPREALEEALRNAIVHKDYESGIPIHVSVFGNRVVITNIGGIPESWTVETLAGDHSSRPRNPLMASALHSFGHFPGIGTGIALIRHSCEEAGLPEPIFDARPDETSVTFFFTEQQKAPVVAPAMQGQTTAVSDKPAEDTFASRSVAAANNLDMSLTDEYILKIFNKNGRATAVKIAQILGISESTVRRSFKRLVELGFIERVGSNKTGYWKVLK